MPVRLIAHRIEKKQHSKETQSLLRVELLPSSDKLASMFMKALRTAVNHRNPVAARFERVAIMKSTLVPMFETAYCTLPLVRSERLLSPQLATG